MAGVDLFESRVNEVVKGSLDRVLDAQQKAWNIQVKKNWDFYFGDQVKYIEKFPGEKPEEFTKKKKAPFNYTAAVIDEYIAGVYQMHVNRTFNSDINNNIYKRINSEFQMDTFFRKVQKIAELSALCAVVIRTNESKSKIFYEEVPGEFIKIYHNKNYPDGIEHIIFAYYYDNETGSGQSMRVEGWSREKVVVYETCGRDVRKVFDAPNTLKDANGDLFIPIAFFKPDEDAYSLYGHTNIDAVVEINDCYNNMWMDIMRTVRLQQFSLLVVKRPSDMRGEAPRPLEIAPTRLIEDTSKDFDAKYITPDPKINEALAALRSLREDMLDLSKVPIEVIGGGSKRGVEASSTLRVKRVPLERVWKQRKASYTTAEEDLAKKTVLVAKNVWGIGDINDLRPQIDYGEMSTPMDTSEKLEKDVQELHLGLTNPYKLYLEKDPDIGDLEAAAIEVHKNIEATKKVMSGVSSPGESIGDFIAKLQSFKKVARQIEDEI